MICKSSKTGCGHYHHSSKWTGKTFCCSNIIFAASCLWQNRKMSLLPRLFCFVGVKVTKNIFGSSFTALKTTSTLRLIFGKSRTNVFKMMLAAAWTSFDKVCVCFSKKSKQSIKLDTDFCWDYHFATRDIMCFCQRFVSEKVTFKSENFVKLQLLQKELQPHIVL